MPGTAFWHLRQANRINQICIFKLFKSPECTYASYLAEMFLSPCQFFNHIQYTCKDASGVPQVLVSGPMPFNLLITNREDRSSATSESLQTLQRRGERLIHQRFSAAIQTDLDRAERTLAVPADTSLYASNAALRKNKVNSLLSPIRKNIASWLREAIFQLCSALVRHLECWAPFWASQYKTDMDLAERVQQTAMKINGSEHLTNKGRPRAGILQPGEEKVQGDVANVHKYLMGQGWKERRLSQSLLSSTQEKDKRKLAQSETQ